MCRLQHEIKKYMYQCNIKKKNLFLFQSRKALERITVPKIYHPFIQGPFGERAAALSAETGARIHIPPASTQSDEIVIAGEKNGVLSAKAQIEKIYEEMVIIFYLSRDI